ncbi:malto-oligosyltrehalose synthase [soil metagenome]
MPPSTGLTNRDLDLAKRVARDPARVPRATYRIQLNQDFPFSAAMNIASYLAELGISDLYASPIFAAAPGSMHGYDIVDYGRINNELGGRQGFAALAGELETHGLSLMLDFVPNHMGIVAGANPWWQDVLENGQASPFAAYFDIDWQPLKPELEDQVLVPVLSDYFGLVLERGELQLGYEGGAFAVHYYAAPLPIAPPTYPLVLNDALELVRASFEPDDLALLEFQSIIAAFERLAPNHETDVIRVEERLREQFVGKHRLNQLAGAEPVIGQAIGQIVEQFNGQTGDASSFDDLESLLNAQSYRPAYWRVAAEEINYRRFFAINELAAIRQEAPGVLEATHKLLFELIGSGDVSGVRIDHPDGLWDPAGYFRDVQLGAYLARCRAAIESRRGAAVDEDAWDAWRPGLTAAWEEAPALPGSDGALAPPLYVVVEKILEHGENVPGDWQVAGTVGYEFARVVTGLFVEASNRKTLDDFYARFTGDRIRFGDLVYEQKKQIMRVALASEVNVLARALDRLTEHNRRTRDFTLNSLRTALREIVACFPIYRTYTICNGSEVLPRDRRFVEAAVNEALRRNPARDRGGFEFIRDALLLNHPDDATAEQRDELCNVVMKVQQLSGPVMAKGLEDTAFFSFNRLLSLNEVGGDPSSFGSSPGDFHKQCISRAQRWPAAMLTSSTHDTKRGEDVRARISSISEMPREWRAAVNRWARMNRKHKARVQGSLAPDRNDEYHLYQTLIGVWPFDSATPDEEFIERIATYMIKTVREAQVHSSWINPGDDYETAVTEFVRAILTTGRRNQFPEQFAVLAAVTSRVGAFTSLSQQVLKLTAPGVPDIYQGTELWDFSLVDPDNRRQVDFSQRKQLLKKLKRRQPGPKLAAGLLGDLATGEIKLFITQRALAHRADHSDFYLHADYAPLEATGPLAAHVIAYQRTWQGSEIIVVVPRLMGSLLSPSALAPVGELWRGALIALPGETGPSSYTNIFTGIPLTTSNMDEIQVLDVAEVLAIFPVALLHRSVN